MTIADAPFLMGGILIVAGLLVILFQFFALSPGRGRLLEAVYPGAVFIGIGMALLVMGAFAHYV